MTWRILHVLLCALTVLAWAVPCRADDDAARGDYVVDRAGRSYRVRFDPGNELRIGMLGGVWRGDEGLSADPAVTAGLALRTETRGGMKHEEVQWHLEHRILWSRVRPWSPGLRGIPTGEVALYRGSYARHTEEPFLMLPGDPPKRMFFPFDVGVIAETGRLRLRTATGEHPADELRVGVVRGAVMLDPWRSGRAGNGLQVGLGARYDVDLTGHGELDTGAPTHRLAPFTEGMVRLRLQDGTGRTALGWETTYSPHWDSKHGWQSDALESNLELERVLIAINDMPVSFALDAGYERTPAPGTNHVRTELRALAGVNVGWQLRE